MTRRDFLIAGMAAPVVAAKGDLIPPPMFCPPGEPVLQAPSETSVGVVWAVNRLSTGAVEIADNPDFKDVRIVKCGDVPLRCLDDRVLRARVRDLEPAHRYWYRTVTQEIISANNPNCSVIRRGRRLVGRTYSFVTPGARAESRFCVMNDTHAAWASFMFTTAKLKKCAPPVVVWNGDATNCTECRETAVGTFLAPSVPTKDYAAETPVLWTSGNHDYQGLYASHLGEVMLERPAEEREPRFADLVRNFAVRQGEIALIGLDTGEGIHDDDERLCGLGDFARYRTLQTAWLESALARPEITSAPYVVAFCHIPLWNTGENPFGCEEPRRKGCASWIRACYEQWGPVLDRHGVQLVVCGHEHRHRWDDEIPNFRWKQVLGGGPELGIPQWGEKGKFYFPTLIEGFVENGVLVVRTHDTWRDRMVDERRFQPRKV